MDEREDGINKSTEIRHLLRTVKTALELAIVVRAPADLLNRLGRASGLLDAVSQLPIDGGAVEAMAAGMIRDARAAIDDWNHFERGRTPAA